MTWMVAKTFLECLGSDREDKGVTMLRVELSLWKILSCGRPVDRDCYVESELRDFEDTMALGESYEWARPMISMHKRLFAVDTGQTSISISPFSSDRLFFKRSKGYCNVTCVYCTTLGQLEGIRYNISPYR